jgi:Zn-dependent protease
MLNTWKIAKPFGIDLYIHWSFWLLPLMIVLSGSSISLLTLGTHLGLMFALFFCVILHEYGHALTARHFGIRTHTITVYPIGGVARMESLSQTAWQEFWITLMGPMINVVIAALLATGLFVAATLSPLLLDTWIGEFFLALMWLNVGVVAFNLLPAFPMDGGRILRAVLTPPLGALKATRVAADVGAVVAALFGVAGFVLLHSIMLLVSAVFIIYMGQREKAMMEARLQAEQWQVRMPGEDDPLPSHGVVLVWNPRTGSWTTRGAV